MEDEELLKIKPDRSTWTWADRMPKLEALLEEIGATNADTYVAPPKPEWTMRPLNEEEDAAYNEEKRVREEKMKAWEEKRRAEMEAEGMSVYKVMERARLLNPSTMIYPKESCVHQMPPIDPVTKKLINPETGEALPDDDPAQVEHLKLRAEVLKPWYEREREREQQEQPAEPAAPAAAPAGESTGSA
jgi:hypothetical protein